LLSNEISVILEEEMILFFTIPTNTNTKCDKYNVKGCQKSLSHPRWPPIITNRCDITNMERTEQKNREIITRKPLIYTVHAIRSNIHHTNI